ncbi:MAG TPA: S8 family serine peptidase [Actinomycetota bacterium]|nr:S8 family serine peptidase [Actinomycetota bacterium]
MGSRSKTSSRRYAVAALVAGMLLAMLPTGAGAAESRPSIRPAGKAVPGSYIVVLRPDVSDVAGVATRLARVHGGRLGYVYSHALDGFSIEIDRAGALAIASDPRVALVEQDPVVRAIDTQANPPYGLDRTDQRNLPLSNSYVYNATGAGTTVYIVDSGVRVTHSDFGGRASHGYDFVDGDPDASDCDGHGTHVAGTVGGNTYGIAKAASLVAVRVLDCNGDGAGADIIAGVDWVTAQHTAGEKDVANMSLGTLLGTSSTIDAAVRNSIADGTTYAIAAGNGGALGIAEDACNTSPSRVAEAITVSATDSSDRRASFANYGTCVDIFAPGVNVLSSWVTNDTATNTISGTSMASPHVAGVAAQYLQANGATAPPAVATALTSNATTGKVTSPGSGSPNRLLYNGFISAGTTPTPTPTPTPPPGNAAPVASFTNTCSGLTCSFTDTSTDSDGTIASRSWNFGDGGTSTAANPSHTFPAAGTYTVTLTVTDNAGATASTSKAVTVSSTSDPDPSTPNLSNGVATSDTNGAAGTWKYYKIQVPAGKSSLRVDLTGAACSLLECNPDLDLYVRQGAKPTATAYACRHYTSASTGSCTISNPAADWWYVGVHVYSGTQSKSYTVKATY